jgi:ribosome-associated protein YbcJ (S4-like RNA binding protein)
VEEKQKKEEKTMQQLMNWRESGGEAKARRERDEVNNELEGDWRRRRRKKRRQCRSR